MLDLAKTIIVFGITGVSMIAFIPIACVLFIVRLIGLGKAASFIMYKLAQGWARTIIFFTGCEMHVTGRENIPRKIGLCITANHVGIFDIMLALGYAGRPFGFIAKKELALIPGLNIWILLLGGLFIDRKNLRKALKTINTGVKRIKNGGGMLIFPEGTRSRGRGMGPFMPGALKLATQSEAVIVPMAITGSYEVFEKNYRVHGVPVYVSFLPAVNPAGLPREDRKQILADKLRAALAEELERHKEALSSE